MRKFNFNQLFLTSSRRNKIVVVKIKPLEIKKYSEIRKIIVIILLHISRDIYYCPFLRFKIGIYKTNTPTPIIHSPL